MDMRYYFHLESETNIHLDHRGREFADAGGVKSYAVAMARELAREDKWLGWKLRVIDAHNTEVICVPIVDAVLSGSSS
ncbi:hypothetical protein [Hyphomicrobium sp.]|uniref:DUF6894 family protein n=1 Tax=Hyphomicrobium sp. TaxID=82 RepID=UPI0025BF3F3D|nr:hypothetical protein [Hyphomicrobium sp.]MCC7252613.1 hypothetical protein [Hyphomicrobium sp.]